MKVVEASAWFPADYKLWIFIHRKKEEGDESGRCTVRHRPSPTVDHIKHFAV